MSPDPHRAGGEASQTSGIVIRTPRRFDLILAAIFLFRERAFRERLAELAQLAPGESVLDVGCGTGSFAMVADQRVGSSGCVRGIDASPEMIARAEAKARQAGRRIDFAVALAEALPHPDRSFDIVTASFLLRHLPPDARRGPLLEMARVARPGGRVFLVDTRPAPDASGPGGRKPLDLFDSIDDLTGAGLEVLATGAVGWRRLHFILATKPWPSAGLT